jgi:hypothetical protein
VNFINYYFLFIEFLLIICGYFKNSRKIYKEYKSILEIILSTIISQINKNKLYNKFQNPIKLTSI